MGGPAPELNEWVSHGKHMVWYSTERDGIRNRIPKFVEDQAAKSSLATIPGAHDLSAITGDGKDLGVDMIMELFYVVLELL